MSKPIMFCIPYAGGSASAYMRWKRVVGDLVEVVPVELAGRGARVREVPHTSARANGEDVASVIESHLAGEPAQRDVIVWGHSMGALVAYEAYHALRRRAPEPDAPTGSPLPSHMVFSGRTPPHIPVSRTDYYLLDEEDFIDAVDTYGGGTAAALRSSKELRDLFLPILRADFEASETYEWIDPGALIDSTVSVVNGLGDESITHERLDGWQDLVRTPVFERRVAGGHFFIFERDDIMSETVHEALAALRSRTRSVTGKALS